MSATQPYQDPRVIPCLSCKGMSEFNGKPCEECRGQGQIRVPTRAEYEAEKKLHLIRMKEVADLRDLGAFTPKIALFPCAVCGKLWQDHPPVYSGTGSLPLRLCPMPGSVLGPVSAPMP